MRSLEDFDINSTSKKHIQRTHTCVIALCTKTMNKNWKITTYFRTHRTTSDKKHN